MKVAVIGTGIAGLVAARELHDEHEVTVFEASDWIGGHTHTLDVPTGGGHSLAIDTGFIVFNERTYPG
ncbi:MAG: NAD(P)-binding protein, partial [Planctomycetota bacterium]|nr:NAD(P)-binding protein [Planctomycetota bacterium]